MARVVAGDHTVMNHMLFGSLTPVVQNYIQQSQANFMGSLNNIGKQFAETANNLFTRLDQSEAMRLAKAALRTIKVYGVTDIIQPLYTEEKIRTAPTCMIPYIMALPKVTDLYNEGLIDGYGDRYLPNPNPIPMGWDNPYYVNVMNGMENIISVSEDEDEDIIEFTIQWDDDLIVGLPPLMDDEAYEIKNTWDHIRWYIKQRKDITSIYENDIA